MSSTIRLDFAPKDRKPWVLVVYSWDSPEHCQRVKELADRLRGDGINCLVDQYVSAPAIGWKLWMAHHLKAADFVVPICTETYYRRFMGIEPEEAGGRGVRWEADLIQQQLYDEASKDRFPVAQFSDGQRGDVPEPLRDCSRYIVDSADGYRQIRRHVLRLWEAEMPPLGELPKKFDPFTIHNLPARNGFFTGREKELAEIEERLARRGLAVLSGLGGTGKTGTAKEYAHRHRAEYGHVFWVSADNPTVLLDGFVAIARLVGVLPRVAQPDEMDPESAVGHVKHWLAEHEDWLLVFDNADDDADQPHKTDMLRAVKDHLPGAHRGHVLVTTRRPTADILGVVRPVEIHDIRPEDARQFLLRRTGREDVSGEEYVEAGDLARDLGYLALALEQAAAFILDQEWTFAEYRDEYNRQSPELKQELLNQLKPVMGEREGRPLATTWLMNFETVETKSAASAELLRLLAFVHPEDIPLEMIIAGGPEFGEQLAAALADGKSVAAKRLVKPLRRYSLVMHDPASRTLSVHRLVQQVLLANLDDADCRAGAEAAVAAVAAAHPGFDFKHWDVVQRWLPHALVAADWIEKYEVETEAAGLLLQQAGRFLHDQGLYAEAEPLYQRSLAIREKVLGPDHPDVATSLNNLAGLYHDQGQYAEAEPLYQRSLAIKEKVLGPEHPDVATSLNNLALLYHDQGQYAEAEPLYQRSLAIKEKVLGPEHPDVATSLNNLALLYHDQGQYAEAEPMYQRSLAIKEKVLGPEHPSVAASLNNLAELYRDQGQYAQAEPLYQRSLAIDQKVFGPEHPDVATDLNNLALLYHDQGQYAEAEPLYQRSLAIREKVLGPDHPDVATSLNNLALLYDDQGQYAEAEPLYQRSLAIREKVLGPEHPDVAKSLWCLAILRRAQEQGDEAAGLFARALSIFETALPAEHPHQGNLLIQYAAVSRELGRDVEADAMESRGQEIRAKYARGEAGWSGWAFLHAAPFGPLPDHWPRPLRGGRRGGPHPQS